jgi:hypothetical protein
MSVSSETPVVSYSVNDIRDASENAWEWFKKRLSVCVEDGSCDAETELLIESFVDNALSDVASELPGV